MNWIVRIRMMFGALLIGLLAGCGGGGGGGAGGAGPYTISLRVDRASLPLNIAGNGPNIGGRYTSTIYVDARDNAGRPIPGGEEIFGCSVTGGLDTGALYYLDGDPEHETTETIDGVEVTYQNAYRAVTLPSNAGSSSFHFHAGDTVGSVVIRCTVSEPNTNIQRAAQTTIQVGGTSTGLVSQVVFDRFSPNFLYRQGLSAINGATQLIAQVRLVDEAGQPVVDPAPGSNSVELSIVPDSITPSADDDALLRGIDAGGVSRTAQTVHARTINGQAQFTLISGSRTGTLLLKATADRADNNISNGAQNPIINYIVVPVVETASSGSSISITTDNLPSAAFFVPYGAALEATGGTAPYTWEAVTNSLPDGLSVGSSGVISGLPTNSEGTVFSFVVRVRDANGQTAQKTLSLTYTPPAATTPTPTPTAPVINQTTLTNGTAGQAYATVMTASGGTAPYSWTAVGLPTGLTITTAGVINGTPTVGGTFPVGFTVTGANGLSTSSVINLLVTGNGSSGTAPTLAPTTLSVSECTTDIPFIIRGGTAPFSTFSTDSLNVTTTTPVRPAPDADFFVFTVSTTATTTVTSYTVSVLDAESRVATSTLNIPINTHLACSNYPKLTLLPTAIVATPMSVGDTQVITIQGGGDSVAPVGIVFTPNTSDASVVSIAGAVSGPDGTGAYRFTIAANAVGTVIISVRSEDGQNAYIPVVVGP